MAVADAAANLVESESMPSLLEFERRSRGRVGGVRVGGGAPGGRGHVCHLERLDRMARKQQQTLNVIQQQQQLDVGALQNLCKQQDRLSVVSRILSIFTEI